MASSSSYAAAHECDSSSFKAFKVSKRGLAYVLKLHVMV